MMIKVTDVEGMEVIFEGNANDFLEANDYDEEIAETLNELDNEGEVGDMVMIYGFLGDKYEVEKMEDENLFD